MTEESSVPEQKDVESKPNTPALSQDFFKHPSNLLLVAGSLIFLGFFFPWISIGGYNNNVPAINGTFLLSHAGQIPNSGPIVLLLLISIPVCSGIIAYNSYNKNLASIKTIIICVSLSTFIPVLVFFFSFFASGLQELNVLGRFGEAFSLGFGLLLMTAGSAYCLFFVASEVLKDNRVINSRELMKHAVVGAIATTIALLILYKSGATPGWMVVLHLVIFATGIIITNNIHAQSIGKTNYGRTITLGFLVSAFTIIMLLIMVNIFYSKELSQTPAQGSLLFLLLLIHIQVGFIITSISGAITNVKPAVRWVPPVADVLDQTGEQKSVNQAPVVVSMPPLDLRKIIAKNKMVIIIVSALAVCGIALWFIFKADPESDAKKAAVAYCNCSEKYSDGMVKADEDFMNSFNSNNFKKRQEAKNKLQELQNAVAAISVDCNGKALSNYTEKRNKYLTDANQLKKFDLAYGSLLGTCNPGNQSKLASMNAEIESKISTIKDPEPDIEKIKSDLIGKKIPGWNFDALSEIDQAKISNVAHGSDRVEYTIDLHLIGFRLKEPHDAEIFVTYSQEEDGWQFGQVKEIFYTYTNTAPVNNWLAVTPLQNCTYKIIDNGQQYWVQDGSYGQKYKGGGSDADQYNLRSPQIFLMSREDHPVDLVFRYTPNN
jgi:hypothetical protein